MSGESLATAIERANEANPYHTFDAIVFVGDTGECNVDE